MKVEQLYADEARRASREASLGDGWTSESAPDATFKVFWIEATGEVFALRHGPDSFGPGIVKPYGIHLPEVRPAYPEDQEVTVLGTCPNLGDLTRAVDAPGTPRTLEWLRGRLT